MLENLQDEENPEADHPKLWKNFALAMGADKNNIENVEREWFTNDMIENFFTTQDLLMLKDLDLYTLMKDKYQK